MKSVDRNHILFYKYTYKNYDFIFNSLVVWWRSNVKRSKDEEFFLCRWIIDKIFFFRLNLMLYYHDGSILQRAHGALLVPSRKQSIRSHSNFNSYRSWSKLKMYPLKITTDW